jgi:hypothetical protein
VALDGHAHLGHVLRDAAEVLEADAHGPRGLDQLKPPLQQRPLRHAALLSPRASPCPAHHTQCLRWSARFVVIVQDRATQASQVHRPARGICDNGPAAVHRQRRLHPFIRMPESNALFAAPANRVTPVAARRWQDYLSASCCASLPIFRHPLARRVVARARATCSYLSPNVARPCARQRNDARKRLGIERRFFLLCPPRVARLCAGRSSLVSTRRDAWRRDGVTSRGWAC